MSIPILIDKMQEVQKELLKYLDEENDEVFSFNNLMIIIEKNKIKENAHEFKLFLRLLINISNYHKSGPGFFNKVERILNFLKEDIKSAFTSNIIFNFSKTNRKILLFFIKEKIVIIDEHMAKDLVDNSSDEYYRYYFYPEIKPFINDIIDQTRSVPKWIQYFSKGIPEDFEENRKIGENEHYICELIRKDLIEDFIIHVNKNNIPLKSLIKGSIYETHPKLIVSHDNDLSDFWQPSLIKYAAFFGSIQIFQYLLSNGVDLDNEIWEYAIYSNNPYHSRSLYFAKK